MLREPETDSLAEDLNGEDTPHQKAKTVSQEGTAAATPAPTGFLPVLKNRNFLVLWSGQVFSQLADKVYLVLMIAIIGSQFDTPDRSISGWVSAVMVAFTIPAVLFGSLAGVYVDRWSKQAVLVLTNLLRGVLVIALPFLLWASQDWGTIGNIPVGFGLLLAVTFAVSTLTQFFAPAEQAMIPLIVKMSRLLSANSLYTTTMMASVIIGFAIGEPLLALADSLLATVDGGSGWGKSFLVGGGYLVAGLLLMVVRVGNDIVPEHEPPHPWEDIKEGVRYLNQKPAVRNAIVQLVVLFSVFAALAVLAVRLAEVMPSLKSSQFGFLLAAGGVGMAVGAAFIGQFGQRINRRRLSLLGSTGMAGVLIAMAFVTQQLWPTLGLIALLGFFAAAIGIPMQTTIQEETPAEMRGKVFGLQNNVVNIALSLPLALASVAESWLGLSVVLSILGGVVVTGGLLTWYSSDTGDDSTINASLAKQEGDRA
ncbi:MFS transporter [Oscillatoria sp. CS-180]|uniref:MFS transporter n=1 Tax=Oscillatoria sp. CS-180 TaxID=3021720 RepID=UPI00232E6870|nr:MFS transporter [Oscillatoria sp. CS-180]MDB9526116.1 MFS transporter [Oscillatoria sp. CS-180]